MKILFISIPSIHAIRWVENMNNSSHELFWFDILDRGPMKVTIDISQIINWKKRKIPYVKGEYLLRKKVSCIYNKIQPFLEVTINEKLEQLLQELQPDLVHSFEMQSCSYPIVKTMQKFPTIKWLYSCWGSDLYRFKEIQCHLPQIQAVLKRVQYLHTDCERDRIIAKEMGFNGKHIGVIPGGGGFHLDFFSSFIQPILERKIIVAKGYQHQVGRGLVLVKALQSIEPEIQHLGFNVVIFGAHQVVIDYVKENQLPYLVYDRHGLPHQDLLEIMGQSILYLGNSISDGMPNTLLEAIIMGAFPIQSNPGNVTAEIITQGKNGFLIENPNDEKIISKLILKAIENPEILQNAFKINQQLAKERLEYSVNQQKIVALYQQIESEQCE